MTIFAVIIWYNNDNYCVSHMLRKVFVIIISCLIALGAIYIYYYHCWKHLWLVAKPLFSYPIHDNKKDTLRVLMIGDSWAAIHLKLRMDSFLCSELKRRIQRPVSVVSKGKGGEKSRGIYQLMFQTEEYGTKPLFFTGVDYCIISAGINDAAANLGTKQFCAHYRMIINFLLSNNIRPVIIEIPDVDLWNIYGKKTKKDLLVDFIRSTMTNCRMYNLHEYREALLEMLHDNNLMQHVLYVPMTLWNGEGVDINPSLFMSDKIHLNRRGYERLDHSIATAIVWDLEQSKDSTFVHQPVNENSQ